MLWAVNSYFMPFKPSARMPLPGQGCRRRGAPVFTAVVPPPGVRTGAGRDEPNLLTKHDMKNNIKNLEEVQYEDRPPTPRRDERMA